MDKALTVHRIRQSKTPHRSTASNGAPSSCRESPLSGARSCH
ncbi:hypothetical protein FM111_14200 [Brevundimonas diminuta 3F5N]|uniref:Uncharacterized protein n=1 Tax=Brevundimonas diminuta 3F5N TaxID=1255603 RepID=A0A1R4GN20_BREDI|nr:hypothetical protein FM111_14200 [Brevundimonas diminuta 3F5N]